MGECSMRSFCTQRFLKLICLHLPTDSFMKTSFQSTGRSGVLGEVKI